MKYPIIFLIMALIFVTACTQEQDPVTTTTMPAVTTTLSSAAETAQTIEQAKASGDITVCESMDTQLKKDSCIYEVLKNDINAAASPDKCSELLSETIRVRCYDNYYFINRDSDPTYCALITTAALKDRCDTLTE